MSILSSNKSIMNISIIGIGNAGINTLENIQKENFNNVNFIYANDDKEQLDNIKNGKIIYLEQNANDSIAASGLLVGKIAASNSIEKFRELILNTHLLILTAGLGGNIGTGAISVMAKSAKEMGIPTIAVVSSPFSYEGKTKESNAKIGMEELKSNVDLVITISNNRLINNYPDIITTDAFKLINNILKNSIKTFINLVSKDSMINLSISDFMSAIKNKKSAYIGFGLGVGRNKIMRAINGVTNSKIIETSIKNASSAILYIVGDETVTIQQINEIIDIFKAKVGNSNMNVFFSFDVNPKLRNEIQISAIATFDNHNDFEVKSKNEKLLHDSQELLIEIGNTLENEFSGYSTGEIYLPNNDVDNIRNNQEDDKDQEKFIIASDENADDDEIPFFLK